MADATYRFLDCHSYKAHSFFCMGGLCEILVETADTPLSKEVFRSVYDEAKRLERKYSRYRSDNLVYRINCSNGRKVSIDSETFELLKFADTLHSASGGLFDITSGVLRRVWKFDGSSHVPERDQVEPLLEFIDWKRVAYEKEFVAIPRRFELDFGGLGKEYAVDACTAKAKQFVGVPTLVNLGGDIAVTGPKHDGSPWIIGLDASEVSLELFGGAVATSGDKNKFLLSEGRKLSHILDPRTGWPVQGAPKSATVVGQTCTEAGSLATLSLLQGKKAEAFLSEEADEFRVIW